ncbi:Interferon-induced very large GTPase 1 [Myotis brandtii]|uniref:Interferon-induced very large GTPase 1 n=1 Tax=Myotis brandtii TaxID=109478 RepID=S7MQ29_MYOBR|nr:Interferon-induced very large GTPase 1 [Myotis brandtii]
MLRGVGLSVEYWLPKLQEQLGVTCAQALQHVEEKDLQKLKSQAQHPWEKKALEKLLNSNSLSKLQESQWVFQSKSVQEHINISQFSELIRSLKKIQNDLMEAMAKSKSEETVVEAQRKATYEVSLSLRYFLNYLQEKEQPDTQLLLLSIAAGAGYHVVNKHFQYLLGCEELNFLLHEVQTAQDKYQELNNICTYRAQAFLVITGLTATIRVTAVSPKEKTQRLTLINQHMGQFLSKEVVHVLSKHGAHKNWENLEKDLRLLINGNYDATISSLQMDEISKNLQSIFHERKQPHEPHDDDNINGEVIKNTAFLELLQHLGLEQFYPKKMSRTNFHLINKTSVYNSKPCSESELHQYFLQKLQVLDYELRYLLFRDDGDTQNQVNPSALNKDNEAFNPYKYLFEDRDTPISPSPSKHRPHIHPMDIQMAILHCADDFARHQIRRSWQEARKSPREEKINYKNKQMCQVSTPIVSFIRVGNGFSASKSQIMNCLLSKRKHDVFFHRHCRGSTKDCLLMGGVVEICWFCPGGEDEDRFDNCVTFTNLHGDAKEHKKQLTFLQEVSSLIVVLMSTSDDNKENQKIIHDLSQSPRPLICLVDNKDKNVDNNSSQKVVIGIRDRNEAELTEELVTTIRRLLELLDNALSLEDCTPIARKQGFLIDEDQRNCKEAKEKAEIAANLLISGAPIELMDGDTSYVPVKWVGAVFDKVSEKLENKRLFVLSILGLQSSGKSTLLNALFGLQFTVSAGRCTRGAYMQLLKVEDTFTEELGFDFVLVVDTEGLRAPELSNKSKNRDNELATFVIGLGNLTLINIFGENPSEMQDILQIVVQAFMRMKQVKISPSCIFIHQNVGEVTAKDQTMEGRRRLEQRLDEMATIAAEQEQCSDVTRFAIRESTAIAKDKSSTVSGWLDLFCDHLGSKLNFPRKDLISIEHQEINDIEFLKKAMSEALDDLMTVVEKTRFSMPEEDMVPEIQNMLSEHLCGCWKQCPFCGAICTNTIPNHDGDHSVPFHRPKAVNGGQWVNTDHFNIDCCTSLVASNHSFVLNGRDIPFKTYRQAGGEFAKWSITPDTSTQPYWKWFVCHFRSNLEGKYEKQFTDKGKIPDAWTKITKQNVLDDLKQQ